MSKNSIASLQERLAAWPDWDLAMYQVGACLGFWPEFGAPAGFDQWHGVKGVMWSDNSLGNAIHNFLSELVKEGCLEHKENQDLYRWNPDYQFPSDLED